MKIIRAIVLVSIVGRGAGFVPLMLPTLGVLAMFVVFMAKRLASEIRAVRARQAVGAPA